MLFSIIVPIYKVEEYLNECILSVLNQDFDDYEMILVDDGSPDNCPSICDSYSHISNVKVIHKQNGGLSDARNAGISAAIGDYCLFLDSDDVLTMNSLKSLACVLEKPCDLLITQMKNSKKMSDSEDEYLFNIPVNNDKDAVLKLIFKERNHEFTSPAQQYIVKTEFIRKHNLSFIVGRRHEDVKWCANIFSLANSFSFFNKVWYLRRIEREGSIMNSISSKNVIDEISIVCDEITSDRYNHLKKRNKNLIFRRLMETYYSQFRYIPSFDADSIDSICKIIDSNKKVLKYSVRLKHVFFSILTTLFGSKFAIKVLKVILANKRGN